MIDCGAIGSHAINAFDVFAIYLASFRGMFVRTFTATLNLLTFFSDVPVTVAIVTLKDKDMVGRERESERERKEGREKER